MARTDRRSPAGYLNGAKLRLSDLHNDDSWCTTAGWSLINLIPQDQNNMIAEATRILYRPMFMFVCLFCIGLPLLGYLPTEIGLYCYSWYSISFLTFQTAETEPDGASVKTLSSQQSQVEYRKNNLQSTYFITTVLNPSRRRSKLRSLPFI